MTSRTAPLFDLFCHPETPAGPTLGISAIARRRSAGYLELRYVLRANLAALSLPAGLTPGRSHGLWRHTCFEAFVCRADETDCLEYNLSPSGDWAAYAFTGYRAGMSEPAMAEPPEIAVNVHSDSVLELLAVVGLAPLCGSGGFEILRIGLSAVIETVQGEVSYWALRHGLGGPDFHDRASFMLEIEPGAATAHARPRFGRRG